MTDLQHCLVERRYLDGARKQALEIGRNRLMVVGSMIILAFILIIGRLADLTIFGIKKGPIQSTLSTERNNSVVRSDILDRNGVVLATSLPTTSLYADPAEVLDANEVVTKLARVLPELNRKRVLQKLKNKGRFVWLARNLSPQLQFEINRLGLPGISFLRSEKRVYPHGRAAAHVLGVTNVDGKGLAGVEKKFDHHFSSGSGPIQLSLDIRVQSVLQEELAKTVAEFNAVGAAGIIMNVRNGEILAMVSMPDYDPNFSEQIAGDAGFNRATKGVYEMGSTFKLFTVATALDMKLINFYDGYDASTPIKISRFYINDFHPQKRWLSVPEIILYSSNIGVAKMGLDIGAKKQQHYLRRFGLLKAPDLEIPEVGAPLLPVSWREISTMTVSYGHGIAVSPVQLISGISSVVNGGYKHATTLLKLSGDKPLGKKVLSEETSEQVRRLMRLVVSKGTGKRAKTGGYLLGGKTGTAEKPQGRKYSKSAKIASFVGAFPIDNPKYSILVIVDEPKGTKKTFNYATGGWVAAPAVGRIVRRMGPIMGITPDQSAKFEIPQIKKIIRQKIYTKKKENFLKKIVWNSGKE